METKSDVVVYDYKTINVRRSLETMTVDAYQSLGWEIVGSQVFGGIFSVNLSFKRSRKIEKKQELLNIQDQIDGVLQNIDNLRSKQKRVGEIPALSIGLGGALVFGGGMSMSMFLGVSPVVVGWLISGIALGLVGVGICVLNWFLFKRNRQKGTAKIVAQLEAEQNKLADLCEQAYSLVK